MKTLFERAYDYGLKVEEKATGIQAEVIRINGKLYLDNGSILLSPISEHNEENFWIVNE